MIPFIITNHSLTLVLNGKQHVIEKTHPNFEKIINELRAGVPDPLGLQKLIDRTSAIKDWFGNRVTVRNGKIFRRTRDGKDEPLNHVIVTRVFEMIEMGLDAKPMLRFLDNLLANPSKRAVDELFLFLEHNGIPLTPDGHFLAYKRVRENYTDIRSGRFDNSIGKIVQMERNDVDEDRNRTCSAGLHFCAAHYLPHFGGYGGNRVVIVKINPADVVAIPADYNNAKGRTWRYEVVGEDESKAGTLLDTGNPVDDRFDYDEATTEEQEAFDAGWDKGYDDGYDDAEAGMPRI